MFFTLKKGIFIISPIVHFKSRFVRFTQFLMGKAIAMLQLCVIKI